MTDPATLRVLVVYHHLPHYRYDVFKRLEEQPDLQVEFAAAATSSDGSIETIPGSALRTFHLLKNVWLGPFLWQRGLPALVLRRRPQVVIFLGDCKHLSTWFSALLARACGARCLFWTIGWFRPESGLHRLYKLTFFRLADKLLIYGDSGRRLGELMGYPAQRMVTIFNSSSEPIPGHRPDRVPQAEFERGLPPRGKRIVTAVLRLNAVKRLDLLIEAIAQLPQDAEVGVLLVGDGPERGNLRLLADKQGVPVWFSGAAYSEAQLRSIYERTLVTVVPSAAGLTVLQSLKFGRPVITHDNMYEQMPESEAIVPDKTGDFYRFGDVEDLARKVEKWLARQELDATQTAKDCRAVLEADWNAERQAEVIGREIRMVARSAGSR